MAALPYIILIQNIYCFLAGIYIIFMNSKLLVFLKNQPSNNLSLINATITPTILLHIITWEIRSVLTVIFQIYLLINWTPTFSYNFDTYFYFNSFELVISLAIQMPPLLIAIERITILLTNPNTYLKLRFYIVFVGITIQCIFCIFCAFMYFTNKVPVVDNTRCWTSLCMLSHSSGLFFSYGKITFSTVYLIVAGICLIVLFKWNHRHTHSKYNVGKLIHQTIYAEFALNLLPTFLTMFCRYVFEIEPTIYGGNYIKVGIITDGLFNSYIISRAPTFKKQIRNNNVSKWGCEVEPDIKLLKIHLKNCLCRNCVITKNKQKNSITAQKSKLHQYDATLTFSLSSQIEKQKITIGFKA